VTYRIVRYYRDHPERNKTIKRGLTLEEAQAHCQNPETSSSTCRKTRRDRFKYGPWFDGYTEEKRP
jgi:hypothetical protein